MRFERLHLERYGHFRDLALDFSGSDIRLHIIHGANEAGKSTTLSAVCDLLFGIPERTAYGFVHGNKDLMIGATLSNRQGAMMMVRRRKGRKDTLLDAQGTALPDSVLAPYLGAVGIETFKHMFGLDHQRLRAGGDQMLATEGDLARSLFQAGSGLSGVVSVLEALKDEADALYSPQRKVSGKPLYRMLAEYEEAEKRMKAEALRAKDWSAAGKAKTEAEQTLAEVRHRLDLLRQEQHRVGRLRRVLPLLVQLDETAARLAGLAEGPELAADFADRWRAAVYRNETAAAEIRRIDTELTILRGQLAELPEPGPLPDHAEVIEHLYRDAGTVARLRSDLPKLERDLQHSDARLAELAVRLGGGLPVAELAERRPSHPLAARIREHIASRQALTVAQESAAARLAAAQDRRRTLEDKRAALGTPVDPAEAIAAFNEGLAAGDLDTRLAAALLARSQAKETAAAALGRLGRWTADLSRLSATAFPDLTQVQDHAAAIQRLNDDRERTVKALETHATALRRLDSERIAEEQAGEMPTPEALKQARDHRDGGWRLIRAGYIDGTTTPAAAAADYGVTDGTLAGAYEQAIRHADDLVDRREREAHRIQRYQTIRRDLADAHAEHSAAADRLAGIDRDLKALNAAWLALWQPCGLDPGPGLATEMAGWLARKDEAVRAAAAERKAAAEVEILHTQAAAVRRHFLEAGRRLGLDDREGVDPSILRSRLRAAIDRSTAAWSEHQHLDQELIASHRDQQRAEVEAAAAEAARAAWNTGWAIDMAALGLSASASLAEAGAALETWKSIDEELADRRQRQERVQDMKATLVAYEAQVARLVEQLGDALTAEDRALPRLDLPPVLYRRWQAATALLTRRTGIINQIALQERKLIDARHQDQEARRQCAELRAGLPTDADPLAEAARAAERTALRRHRDDLRVRLADAGEGRSEAELRAEVAAAKEAALDSDQLAAQAQAIDEEQRRCLVDFEAATEAASQARAALEALSRRAGIGAAAQAASDAARATADYAARWIRLSAAYSVLDLAIKRFRAANEHPLLRRADALFTLMAGTGDNPIARLVVEYDAKDRQVLMGIRRDGKECPVEGMSEGTRDQLYLALRIAAVEAAAQDAEPMPFIADDLFITSDDQRTRLGVTALAELGVHTQVLLFTHHRSVVDAAQATLPAASLRIHSL